MAILQFLDFPTSMLIHLKQSLKLTLRNTTGKPEPNYQPSLMLSQWMMILSSTTDVWRSILPLSQLGRKSLSAEKINPWSLRPFIETLTAQQLLQISRNSGLNKDMSKTKWKSSPLLPNLSKLNNTRRMWRPSSKQLNSATLKPLSERK